MSTTTNIYPVVKNYTVDMSSNNNFVQAEAAQGDGNDTRMIIVELVSNNVPYELDPEKVYVTIAGTKPDGKEIWNECSVEDGKIVIRITYQMTTTVGRSNYQVVIMDKDSNKQLKSFPFFLIVVAAAFDPSYIMSQNEFQALAESITASETAAREAEEYAEKIKDYYDEYGRPLYLEIDPATGKLMVHYIDDSHQQVFSIDRSDANSGHLVVVWGGI